MKYLAFSLIVLLMSTPLYAATKYVSPSGSATWANCTSAETPCSLATANTNADDDDIVILADGDYGTSINPSNSGSAGHMITYQAANKWGAIIKNPTAITYYYGIRLAASYIKIDGIKVDGTTFQTDAIRYLMGITWGVDHIEITNCYLYGPGYVRWTYSGALSRDIWFHGNTVEGNTAIDTCNDTEYGLQDNYGYYTTKPKHGHITIEDNIFKYGGHHNVEMFTQFNVIRNNFMHNEGTTWNGSPEGCTYGPDTNTFYGNRNLQIYDGANADGVYTLLEGNRFGPSGPPPDDDGGDGMTVTAPKNIIRYNDVYSAQNNGVLFKTGAESFADNNRFYNNTIYGSGRFDNVGPLWQGANFRWYGSYTRKGNVIKNNIIYSYGTGGRDWFGGSATIYTDNIVENNLCTNEALGKCTVVGDPMFVDGSLPAITSTPTELDPDLSLQSGSTAINAGTYLTQANGSGSASTTLTVDDAGYFQDGSWGSQLAQANNGVGGYVYAADWIAIGTVGNVAQIDGTTSKDIAGCTGSADPWPCCTESGKGTCGIDYTNNVIYLASAMSWADDANIWLYKKSDGTQVLYGAAPDIGAHEYVTAATTTTTITASGTASVGITSSPTATVTITTE